MQNTDIILASTREHIRLAAPLFDAYRVFYQQSSDEEAAFGFLLERWIARESVLFIALDGGSAIGFVHLYPSFSSSKMRRLWVLNDLFVSPHARRTGVGRMLMRRAEQHARDTGAARLTLSTATDNHRAQALYESEGYVKDTAFLVYNRML